MSNPNAPRIADRRSLAEARAWGDRWPALERAETIGRAEALGRVLAEALAAPRDLPGHHRAIIAGYAVRAADTHGAGPYNPLPQPGAVAVLEGEALPEGADAILAPDAAGRDAAGRIEALAAIAEGEGVERRGEILRAGEPALAPGRSLRAEALALLAELGLARLRVLCRPRVHLAGGAPAPLLEPLIGRDGGEPAPAAPDLILTTDAAGAGSLDLHGLALRPGGGTGLGRRDGVPVVLLPAEPLACLTAYELLAGPLLRRLGGHAAALPFPRRPLPLARKIVSSIGWVDVVRVRLSGGRADPLGPIEGGGLVTACRADGFVIVPAGREGHGPGETVTVHITQTRNDD